MTKQSKTTTGKRIALTTLALALMAPATAAFADGYPTKPVTLVAPYGAGGASDMAARIVAANAPTYLQQGVQVINKVGAGGTVGSTYVYNSRPDGYTLLLARVGTHAVSPAMKQLPYDPTKFTLIGLLEKNPFICVTSTGKPYKTMDDLISAVKSNPGKISYSSAGVGTLHQVSAVMVLKEFGIENPIKSAIHVPYKGGGASALAVLKQETDFVCTNSSSVMGHISSGKMRALITTMPERLPELPDVPTARELGHPGLEIAVGWSAIVGPPKMDPEAVKKWSKVLEGLKADKSWNKMTTKLGSTPNVLSPQETRNFIEKSYNGMSSLVTKLGMKIN